MLTWLAATAAWATGRSRMVKSTAAKESYDEALRIREQLVRSNDSDWVAKLQLARSLNNSGHFEREIGHRDRAIQWHRSAAKLQQELVQLSHSAQQPLHYEDDIRGLIFEPWDLVADLAGSHYHMGILYTEGDQREPALSEHQAAIRLLERLVQEQPGVAEFRGVLALALNFRALLLGAREDLGRAESILVDLLRDTPGVIRFEAGLESQSCHGRRTGAARGSDRQRVRDDRERVRLSKPARGEAPAKS